MFERIKNIKINSIRFKVSLFYTAVLGVILVFYTGILYFGQRHALYRDLDRGLAIKAQEVANAINSFFPVLEDDQRAFYSAANLVIRPQDTALQQENISEAKTRWLAEREKLNLRDDFIVLASTDGKAIANSQNIDEHLLSYLLKGAPGAIPKTVLYRNINLPAFQLRLITIPYYYKNKRMYLIQVGSSVAPIIRALYGRMLFALLIIPLVLIFASFLGGLIAQRILKPVMELTETARNITYKDLSARVKVEKVDEELRYLVDAFNEMISRLENSFRYIAQFSADVAHELKTPLTIIRGESELALMRERNSREYQKAINVTLQETEGMLKTVEDLLLLSRLEYQPQVFNFEELDFGVFMEEIFEQARKMAAKKNIQVRLAVFDRPAHMHGDAMHLKRLFLNLLNNAVKFTPERGSIEIMARREDRKLKVSIKDSGAGIKPGNIDKIFDRFFHVDSVNPGSESGSGLGLSIARSIAKIHRGDISVKSQPQKGSTFTVTLPIKS